MPDGFWAPWSRKGEESGGIERIVEEEVTADGVLH